MSTPGAFADSPTSQSQSSPYSYYPPGNLPDASQQQQQLSQTTTVAAASSTTASTAVVSQPQSRQAAEEARKDRTLAEFLVMLDEYEPLVRVHPRMLFHPAGN
jgi:transcription initiation factor TFIID subunit 10